MHRFHENDALTVVNNFEQCVYIFTIIFFIKPRLAPLVGSDFKRR